MRYAPQGRGGCGVYTLKYLCAHSQIGVGLGLAIRLCWCFYTLAVTRHCGVACCACVWCAAVAARLVSLSSVSALWMLVKPLATRLRVACGLWLNSFGFGPVGPYPTLKWSSLGVRKWCDSCSAPAAHHVVSWLMCCVFPCGGESGR